MSTPAINDTVKAIAAETATHIKFDDTGAAILPKDHFEKSLPEGMTLEALKGFQDHILDYTDGTTLALGEAGIPFLKDHPTVESVNFKTKVGRDQLSGSFTRMVNGRNIQTGEATIKFGVSDTKLVVGKNSKRKDYRAVSSYLSEKATSIFNS